jgi:hypothetical protein
LNVITHLSFIGPTQFKIPDLDAPMLITKNIKYEEQNEFVDTHEEITTNE